LLILSLSLAPWLNAQERPVAFVDVTVVPMNKEQVLAHQTVVVAGGRITQVGSSSSVKVPRDALNINASGKFLMPGLTDMHAHFMRLVSEKPEPFSAKPNSLQTRKSASASSDYLRENEALALLFVANGVTTVRNMWGNPAIDAFARTIDSGHALGPHIYSTGNITDGNPPTWESVRVVETREQADEAVRSDKQAGYIAFKVYTRLSKDAYSAIIAAARREGLPVVGHVPTAVGLSGAIAARQDSIEHLTGFLEALQPDSSPAQGKSRREVLRDADLKKLPPLVQAIKAAGIWNCPTLVVADPPRTDPTWLEQKSFVPPAVMVRYGEMYPDMAASIDPRGTSQGHALSLAILRALHEGGTHLLLGTDATKPGTLPGYSLHEELKNFVAARMTPYEAIRAGTADAAKFLHQESEFGTVATGLRADSLLVESNPLEDVSNVSKLAGVMANGHWFTEKELTKRLASLRASYRTLPLHTANSR
jgi:imidazolonepropionase-like amidohydrolase